MYQLFTHEFSLIINMRRLIVIVCSILMLVAQTQTMVLAADSVIAARVWPAQDYTRITLESSKPFVYKMQVIPNPERVVLDIENIELSPLMKSFNDKVLPSDPYIKQIRVANFQQNTVRLVVDLKAESKANAFTLKPMSEYQHRLVLDLRPVHDPIMAMLAERDQAEAQAAASTKPTDEKVVEQSESINTAGLVVSGTSTTKSSEPVLEHSGVSATNAHLPAVSASETKTVEVKPNVSATEVKSHEVKPAEIKSTDTKSTNVAADGQADEKPSEDKEPVDVKPFVKKAGRPIIIAIDAGHGGEDPGARGASGSREKDITLSIAKKLKEKIDEEPNMQAVLTRDSDFFIPLHGRVVKARAMQADLFISIHADAFTNPAARGSSVFALSEKGATSASARYLAKKENESDLIGGVSLKVKDPILAKTLLDLSQTATINDSLKLGKAVLTKIGDINKLHKSHVEQAGFAVLKSPDIPSILVETAFISNPEEERRLNDDVYQVKLVSSILAGVKKYFASNPALAKHGAQK